MAQVAQDDLSDRIHASVRVLGIEGNAGPLCYRLLAHLPVLTIDIQQGKRRSPVRAFNKDEAAAHAFMANTFPEIAHRDLAAEYDLA